MTVTAIVDGAPQIATVHVTAIDRPTGDKLLDTQAVRDAIKDLWASSGAETEPIANRTEHIAGIYRRPDGSIYWQEFPVKQPATACSADPPDSNAHKMLGDDVLIATIHTHPAHWGESWPSNCPNAGGAYGDPLPNAPFLSTGRASGDDWNTGKNFYGVPGYVIDFDGLYRYDGPKSDLQSFELGGRTYYWVKNIKDKNIYNTWPRTDPNHNCSRY